MSGCSSEALVRAQASLLPGMLKTDALLLMSVFPAPVLFALVDFSIFLLVVQCLHLGRDDHAICESGAFSRGAV